MLWSVYLLRISTDYIADKIKDNLHTINQSINQYYFIMAWQNAGPQFAQIKKYVVISSRLCIARYRTAQV